MVRDGKTNFLKRIYNLVAQMISGERDIKPGSLLEEAMRQTIRVAGPRAASGELTAPSQAEHQRFVNLLGEFPQFANEIINTAPQLHDMEITPEERVTDHENAQYTPDERIDMETQLDAEIRRVGNISEEERTRVG